LGFHGRVCLAVPDDAGLDRLPDVLDTVLALGDVSRTPSAAREAH
jgi:hypothetical protein